MRKFIAILIALTAIHLTAGAQVIRGRLLAEGQPISSANILVYGPKDSIRPQVFLVTDSTGSFEAALSAPGSYTIRTALIGYKPFEKTFLVNEDIDLGDISLQLITTNLQEVTVTARKKLIQRTTTGFTVQTDAILTQASGTAVDLLANIPSVLVDGEGAVTIRGKEPLVLVNGRNSNLGANLQRIPASSIERIEVINNPGAKYDADGEGGVINIILKKNVEAGTNGAFAVGGGKGSNERFNSSFLLNNRAGQVNLGLGYDNRYARRSRTVNTNRETFAADEGHFLIQNRDDDRTEQTHNVKLNADYSGKKHELNFEGIFGYDQVRNQEPLYTRSLSKDGTYNFGNLRFSDERQVERNWEGNLNYNRKFANSKKLLSAGLSHSYGDEEENTQITTTSMDEKGQLFGDPFLQRTKNDEATNITTGRLDMGFPLAGGGMIETGYKGILRHVNADFKNSYEENGSYVPDPRYSNIFDYREQIHAVYGTYKNTAGKDRQWKYELGLRLEQMNTRGNSNNPDTSFTNSFFNVFPTVNVALKLNDGSQLRWNIGRRINRPWLGRLNPFIDITDSLNRRGGNPNLKPELVNTVEMGWGKDWTGFGVNANLFYRRGTNTVLPYTKLLPGGIAFTQPQNIGSSTTYGLESFFTASAGKTWSSTASFSFYNQEIRGEVDGEVLDNSQFTWYMKWVNNFNFFRNTRAQLLFNYQAPTAEPQGERIAQYNVDLGFQQKIMQGRGRLGLTVTDVFNTLEYGNNVVTPDFRISRVSKSDTRAVLVTFAMTFGSAFREKLMENKFSTE